MQSVSDSLIISMIAKYVRMDPNRNVKGHLMCAFNDPRMVKILEDSTKDETHMYTQLLVIMDEYYTHVEKSSNEIKDITEKMIGYRDPSTPVGSRDGIFIAGQCQLKIKASFIMKGIEAAMRTSDWDQVEQLRKKVIEKGWIKMTMDDLSKSTGIKLEESTLIA